MHLNVAQIEQSSIIWILVADGGRAEIYRYHRHKKIVPMRDSKRKPYDQEMKTHELTPVPGMVFEAESLSDFQINPDGRGSLVGGQNGSRNTCEPRLNIHDEVKQNLVAAIALKLNRACMDKNFDYLVIAAAPKILGALRHQLGDAVLSLVIAEIDRDFTKDKNHALLEHLQETLAKARLG